MCIKLLGWWLFMVFYWYVFVLLMCGFYYSSGIDDYKRILNLLSFSFLWVIRILMEYYFNIIDFYVLVDCIVDEVGFVNCG